MLINARDLKEQADDPNGSTNRSQEDPIHPKISSDRRLGIDCGKSGNAVATSPAPRGGPRMAKDLAFWAFGPRRSTTRSSSRNRRMSRWTSRGTVTARSKLSPANFILLLSTDIEVQWMGVEMMTPRQYRQKCVSGTIWRTRLEILPSWTYRAMVETISGGILFTGCNAFRREGMRFRTSCAVVSRLPIYWIQRFSVSRAASRPSGGQIKGVLTSASSDAVVSRRQASRKRKDSKPSFSVNTRRRSRIERSRAASRDIVTNVAEKCVGERNPPLIDNRCR